MEQPLTLSDFDALRAKISSFAGDSKLGKIFTSAFWNTIDTTCRFQEDGSVFVITGDIPAMWLRDSSAQVFQYLEFAEDEAARRLIKGVLKKQFEQIAIDPYANAFMHDRGCISEWHGRVESDRMDPIIWERKYELDSLCFPCFLAIKYIEKTGDDSVLDEGFFAAFETILSTVERERHHSQSPYFFHFKEAEEAVGKDSDPLGEKGLVWSGFRPSDDACRYHYHIPDNMFLVTVLTRLSPLLMLRGRIDLSMRAASLAGELHALIEAYGTMDVPGLGRIYVSETDCLGRAHADDDANIPSLLSLPFLEYPYLDPQTYARTRSYVLSKRNRYYYSGSLLRGIGSPHTPKDRVWPLALAMQGITSEDPEEIRECFRLCVASTLEDGLMHESVSVEDPHVFSRPWFAWANSTFAYFVLKKKGILFPNGFPEKADFKK